MKKKFLGAVLAGALVFSAFSAMAQEKDRSLVVNENKIEAQYIEAEDGTVMIPLRAVCEELGFTVNWIDESRTIEIIKGAVYITCSPDFDGYAFSRMAHQPLGKAPMLIDGTTYVPSDFIGEILGGRVYPWMEPYSILVPPDVSGEYFNPTVSVYATQVGENTLSVVDFERGEVLLKISEETEITDAQGNKIALSDIDTSMQLEVVYGDTMTMSIPAQINAMKITVKEELANVIKEGTVTEIIKDEEGNIVQLILGENEVALNVAAETAVKDADLNAKTLSDIAVGTQLRARTNGMVTRSIPPQMPTLEIMVF